MVKISFWDVSHVRSLWEIQVAYGGGPGLK